ncbi:glycosyltransferase family 2 protein [Oscillatoria sp. CS-180]|uniref:glycosyltransferase family 2 protein n=1 Tax=Oscillatoria sp. CS-180 TaxID=3021720 RepID=UPI00232E84A1|nr:glycosyltransferase family 2 protein [Oscillatoria sp. CS-180]MDB9526431.1 glycosyltransferase family 2 protein [Oscillatoria sp. CS-180]
METAVVLVIFKRPDTTQRVIEAIRLAAPQKLFVIADGPRSDHPEETDKCYETRQLIEGVDWNCQVFKNYSDINLGLKKRISSGLTWVFEQVETAIILEDDCVPNTSFFAYCSELLEKYKDDEKIFCITGHNHLGDWKSDDQSFHFSAYFDCWGWATWRRVWQLYDPHMSAWSSPNIKKNIREFIDNDQQFENRSRVLDKAYNGKIDSWAYPFFFMCLMHSGMTITPAVNVISNVGFSKNATNTKSSEDTRANLRVASISFPLKPPKETAIDREYDQQRFMKVWHRSLKARTVQKLRKAISYALSIFKVKIGL